MKANKKLLTLLLCLSMALSAMTPAAFAEGEGGTEAVTVENVGQTKAASSMPSAEGSVITLTENVTLTAEYEVPDDVIKIDLNGHTLTGPGGQATDTTVPTGVLLVSGGQPCTITNGTIKTTESSVKDGAAIKITNSGNVTLTDVNVTGWAMGVWLNASTLTVGEKAVVTATADSAHGSGDGIRAYASSTVNIVDGGKVNGAASSSPQDSNASGVEVYQSTLNLKNGTVNCPQTGNVFSGAIYSFGGVVNIEEDGVVTSESMGLWMFGGSNGSTDWGTDTALTSAGKITGATAVFLNGIMKKVEITGGSLTSSGSITGQYSSYGGKSIYVESKVNDGIQITGGEIGAEFAVSNDYDCQNNVATAPVVTGGTFTFNPTSYVDSNSGYTVEANDTDNPSSWTVGKFYNITFDLNYTTTETAPTAQKTTAESKLASLPTPTREGYTFNGWYPAQDGSGEKVTTDTVFDANATVYAKWTENVTPTPTPTEYTVTFDANGGTCGTKTATTDDGKLASLPTPTRSGYTFKSWNTKADGTGSTVTTSTTFTGNTTVYAIWTKDRDRDDRDDDRDNSGSSGSSSSSSSTSNGVKTETTKNPDGSTTVTKTDNKTGKVTETNKTSTGTTSTVVTDKNGNVTSASVSVSNTDASSGETVTLPIDEVRPTSNTNSAQEIDVNVPNGKEVKVEIPVKNPTPGTVVVIVDESGNQTIVPTTQLTENGVSVTLTGNSTIKVVDNSKTFNDVPEDNVFSDEIAAMSARNIMVGKDDETFDLYSEVTLNQIVNVAGRVSGNVNVNDYAGGVAWGEANGLPTGDKPATRGNVLTALWIAAGCPSTENTGVLNQFTDVDTIPDGMASVVLWAVENGIIKGNADGTLGLNSNVTRGQAAAFAGRALNSMA